MNISKLIEILQDIHERYGDIPVNADNYHRSNPFDYAVIRVVDDRKGEERDVKCIIVGYEPKPLKDNE